MHRWLLNGKAPSQKLQLFLCPDPKSIPLGARCISQAPALPCMAKPEQQNSEESTHLQLMSTWVQFIQQKLCRKGSRMDFSFALNNSPSKKSINSQFKSIGEGSSTTSHRAATFSNYRQNRGIEAVILWFLSLSTHVWLGQNSIKTEDNFPYSIVASPFLSITCKCCSVAVTY